MKKTFIITTLLLFTLVAARAQQQGIKFETDSNWEQVLSQAKAEHKYIFVDCYATWCGPCKYMDANIYPKKEVGDAYSDFIAIRVQMDQTPKDNDKVKSWHYTAVVLAKNYNVNAYPTFLFFDPDGKPVHKATGSLDEKGFIQLASDAQNPNKQYYSILNNFQPGKLDTAEEKALAFSFINSDKLLAAKLAQDYFSRIPKEHVPTNSNIELLQSLQEEKEIKIIPGSYLQQLSVTAMAQSQNLDFAESFKDDSLVRRLTKKYINELSAKQSYNKRMLQFIADFTDGPQDKKAFNLFYRNPGKVDAIMGRDAAESEAQTLISNAEFKPVLSNSKQTGIIPNFDSIKTVITQKYNADYAERVYLTSKPAWYGYLLKTKHDKDYWPQYVAALIADVNYFRTDTAKSAQGFINDISYKIFAFDTVKEQLQIVSGWMKELTERNPGDPSIRDTYASLLYKAGQTDEAIAEEEKALDTATKKNDKENIDWCGKTINKMKAGEAIWTEKEYQQ